MLFPDDVWRIIMDFIEGMVLKERQEWWKELHYRRKKDRTLTSGNFYEYGTHNMQSRHMIPSFGCIRGEWPNHLRSGHSRSGHMVQGLRLSYCKFESLFRCTDSIRNVRKYIVNDNYCDILTEIQKRKFIKTFAISQFSEAENDENQEFTKLFAF